MSAPPPAPAVDDAALLKMVDMNKPIIPQIVGLLHKPVSKGGMDKAMYLRWVHTPYYFKEEPKFLRFFESDSLEIFSKVRECHFRCRARCTKLVQTIMASSFAVVPLAAGWAGASLASCLFLFPRLFGFNFGFTCVA